MKKKLTVLVAILCVTVLLTTTLVTSGMFGAVGGSPASGGTPAADASTLASSNLPATSVAPAADDPLPKDYVKWDGTMATGFAKGSGTRSDPFLISTPNEFAFLIQCCKDYNADPTGRPYYSSYYRITNDLVFNDDFTIDGTTLSDEVKATLTPFNGSAYTSDFKGVIDGGGHKLYNLYIPYVGGSGAQCSGIGIFGQIMGTIADMHVVRGYMNGIGDNYNRIGGGTIARVLIGGALDGCSSSMTYVFEGSSAGGLVGLMQNSGASKIASITNCTFLGSIYNRTPSSNPDGRATDGTGGIVGIFNGDSTLHKTFTITDCVNRGTVLSNGRFIGGIVGKISGSHNSKPTDFSIGRCVNYGTVASTYIIPGIVSEPEMAYVGGIVGGAGHLNETNSGIYYFEHCANFGTVTAQEHGVGGMIGGLTVHTRCYDNPLRFYACYSLGTVKNESYNGETNRFGGKCIGGFVGQVVCPAEFYECTAGGTVAGNEYVGGVIGRLTTDNPYSGAGKSLLTISSSHIYTNVVGNRSVGGIVGRYVCGSSKETTKFTMTGSYVTGTVKGEKLIGGAIGELIQGEGGKMMRLITTYSVVDVRVERTQALGQIGSLIGGSTGGSPSEPTFDSKADYAEFYVSNEVYDSSSGTVEKMADAKLYFSNAFFEIDTVFIRENLTNGTYLNRLEFGSVLANATEKWVASTKDKTPIQQNADRMYASPLTRSYDGTESTLTHRDWLGAVPVAMWQEKVGDEWVTLSTAPKDVGTYRVMAAVLTARAAGAAVVEFEITKQVVDFSTLKWGGDLAPEYTGLEHVVELAGVPEGITMVYTGNRGINANEYVSHLVSVSDDSGNFEIKNVDAVQDQKWLIRTATIDYNNIEWSYTDPTSRRPLLTYNGEMQEVLLIEKVAEGETPRDIKALLSATYTGNIEKNVGTYSARVDFAYSDTNVQVAHGPNGFDTTTWSIQKRVIDPINDAQFRVIRGNSFIDGTTTTDGVKVTYDAFEYAIAYRDNLPDVEVTFVQNIYKDAGKYPYNLTFRLTDTDNNEFAGTTASETTIVRYLEIEKAVPKIYGAISQDTTFVVWDKNQQAKDEEGNPKHPKEPQTFAIGVQYNQDKTIALDPETGLEIPLLRVGPAGESLETFQIELAKISTLDRFTVRYYQLKDVVDGDTVRVDRIPVTNMYGNEMELDGSWARPYNVGTYEAVVTYRAPEDSNFTDATTTATLIINPAKYKLDLNIVMRDTSVAADGNEQELHLLYEENLPSFIIPVYTCNGGTVMPTESGKYLFRVDFKYTEDMEDNLHPLASQQAYLTIVTDTLIDYATKLTLSFREGTYYRFLVQERTDVGKFVTDWSVGYNTALQSLYQIELKDELSNIYVLDEAATLRLPLTPEMASVRRSKIQPVLILINRETGKYTIEKVAEDDFRVEIVSNGRLPTYVDVDVTRLGTKEEVCYYGVVTPSNMRNFLANAANLNLGGRIVWILFAGSMIPPAAILITVAVVMTVVRKRRKTKREKDNHSTYDE